MDAAATENGAVADVRGAANFVLRDERIYYSSPRFSFPAVGARSVRDLHHIRPVWAGEFPTGLSGRYRLLGLSQLREAEVGYRWNIETQPDEPQLGLRDYIAYRNTNRPPAALSGYIEILDGPYQTVVNGITTEYVIVHQTFDTGQEYIELLARYQISETQSVRLWIIRNWTGGTEVPQGWFELMAEFRPWDGTLPSEAPKNQKPLDGEADDDALISSLFPLGGRF